MARRQRYLFDDDDSAGGITPSQLKRASRERKKKYMRFWFNRMFEDPAQETPYNSREGGYLYIWGGPYDARQELEAEFGNLVSFELIEEVAEELEGQDGISDWAPGPYHPVKRETEEEWDAERDAGFEAESLEQIINRLKSGVRPSYGSSTEREQRNIVLQKLAQLRSSLEQVKPAHGGMGHNKPPPDDDCPQSVVFIEIHDAEETISRELAKAEPNAIEVANATSRLKKALGWLGKKLDKAVDGFSTALGTAAGLGLAAIVAASAAKILPAPIQLITDAIQLVTQWLSYVTTPF